MNSEDTTRKLEAAEPEALAGGKYITVAGERLYIVPDGQPLGDGARAWSLYRAPYDHAFSTGYESREAVEAYATGDYLSEWRGYWHQAPDVLAGATRYDSASFHAWSATARLEAIITEHEYRYEACALEDVPALEVAGGFATVISEATEYSAHGGRPFATGDYVQPVRVDVALWREAERALGSRAATERARGVVTITRGRWHEAPVPAVVYSVKWWPEAGEWRAIAPLSYTVLRLEDGQPVMAGQYATEPEAMRSVVARALGILEESAPATGAGLEVLAGIAGAPHVAGAYLLASHYLAALGEDTVIMVTMAGHDGHAPAFYESTERAKVIYESALRLGTASEPLVTRAEREYATLSEALG